MNDTFGRIISQSGAYALGNMALKLGGLLVLPLYVNWLSEADFGYFSLLDVTARLLTLVVGLGLASGLQRFATQETDAATRRALPFTTLVLSVGAAGFAVMGLWAVAPALASVLLDDPDRALLVRFMAVFAALKVVQGIPMMFIRASERAVLYVAVTLVELVLLVGGVYVLLVVQARGLRGVMEAYVLSAGATTLVLTVLLLVRTPWRFRPTLIRPLMAFGLPLVLAGLGSLFLNFGDRYLLKWLADPATVGVYDWSARIGGTLNMLFVNSFQMAFGIIGLKALGHLGAEAAPIYRRTFKHYVIWTGWGVLGVSLLAFDLTKLLARDPAYLAADVLVFPIALGYLMLGIYYIVFNVIFVRGQSRYIAGLVFAAAIANALLNVVLIPYLGALGAALSTLFAYTVQMGLMARRAVREMAVRYPWGRLVHVLLLLVPLYLLGLATAPWDTVPRLAARLGLIAAYPMLTVLTGLYMREEVAVVWRWIGNRVGAARSSE